MWRFYFRLYRGAIRTPQVVEFLKALQATIGRKLLIIWDRLQAHRSRLVREHVDDQHGRIALEQLPAYAPELNPLECIWGYLKHHAMPNYCAADFGDLADRARAQSAFDAAPPDARARVLAAGGVVLKLSRTYGRLNRSSRTLPGTLGRRCTGSGCNCQSWQVTRGTCLRTEPRMGLIR